MPAAISRFRSRDFQINGKSRLCQASADYRRAA
jgi:hypothetical protein